MLIMILLRLSLQNKGKELKAYSRALIRIKINNISYSLNKTGKYYFESVSNLLLRNPSVEKQFKHKKICFFLPKSIG